MYIFWMWIFKTGTEQDTSCGNPRLPETEKPTGIRNSDHVDRPCQCVGSNGRDYHPGGPYI